MALYEITAPDGSVYEIEGPEGASQQSLILAAKRYERQQRSEEIQRRLREIENRPEAPPETTFGGNLKEVAKGVIPGAIGLVETAGTGIAALLPEDTEKAARAKLKEIAGIAKKPFEAAPGYEESVGRKFGEALGSTLPFFAAAPFGVAGRVAAAGAGVAAGAGEAREAAEAKGATGEERRLATQLGAPTGLLDILAPNIPAIRGIITTALARGGVEGATEAAQKIAQNLIAKGVYDPSQPVLAGSGEEGAYGAGVGAFASLIMDMALGRRARKATPGDQKPDEKPVGRLDQEAPVGTQGEMFQPEKEAELARAAEMQGPQAPLPTDFKLEAQEAPRAEQLELDLPEPVPDRDTRTRDMIDEMETADVKRMIDEGETAQIEALYAEDARKAEEAKAESARQIESAALDKERLKFESDLAEIDGRLQAKQQKTTEDNRMAVLLPIIENPEVQNIGPAFQAELRRQGFADTNPTPREQNLIQRANDLRVAEEVEPVAEEPIPSAPAENQAMEKAVPERTEQREPQQLGLPGMGKPKGVKPQVAPEEVVEPEAQYATVLTPEVLDKTGLPKQSGFYRELVNKDMADPAQQPQVASVLQRVRANPNLTPATKQAIESVAMQAFGGLAKQTSMIGPRGGVVTPSGTKERQRETPSGRTTVERTDAAGSGVGAGGAKATDQTQKAPAGAKRTEAPKPAGLGTTGQPATVARDGKVGEPPALKRPPKVEPVAVAKRGEKKAAPETKPAEKPKAAAKTEVKPAEKPEAAAKTEVKPAEKPKAEAKPAEKPKAEAKPAEKPKAEAKPAPKRTAAQEEAVGNYMAAAKNNAADALRYLAGDIYNATFPQHNAYKELNKIRDALAAGKFPELKFGREGSLGLPGLGGKHAKAFFESLSDSDKALVLKDLQEYFGKWHDKATAYMATYNAQQDLARATKEQMDNLELPADQVVLLRSLHPAITDALKAGKLADALRMLAAQQQGRPSKIAQKLLDALGSTKVQVVEGLELDGKPVAGYFDPKTNTIKLDADKLVTHGLLHEVTHAAVSHVLSNKSHPVTKQLTELYNSVKDSLDTAYGAQSLDEFVSEAFSNPDFQTKLAAINPKGEPISALQRFFTTVGNFIRRMLGMDTKAPGSALDATDALVNQILSPAPETRSGEPLALAALLGKGKEVIDGLATRAHNAPVINNEWVSRAHEFFTGTAPGWVKNIVRSALPANALVDVAKRYIPMAPTFDKLISEQRGSEEIRNKGLIEPAIANIVNWAKANPKLVDNFNNVVSESTLNQVDPSNPRSYYTDYFLSYLGAGDKVVTQHFPTEDARNAAASALKEKGETVRSYDNRFDDSGNNKAATWDKLQKDWKAIGSEGQTVYKHTRDTYKKMYEEIRRILNSRIDDAVRDKGVANKLKQDIYEKLFASGRIEPYFPLTRTGKYWLSYEADGEVYVEAFENRTDRSRAIKELTAAGAKNLSEFMSNDKKDYKSAPPTSFVNSVLRTLEANKIGAKGEDRARIDAATEDVMRLFLNALPETSFAQSFRRRKGTLGFERDALRALRVKGYSLSRQLANMEYGAKLSTLKQDIADHVKEGGNKQAAVEFQKELNERIDYAMNPYVPPWSKLATSFGFNMTLGLNVSSAVINMSQIPLVVMPYLGGKYGLNETTKAIGRATKVFMGSGLSRDVELIVPTDKGDKKIKRRAFLSIDNYDFEAAENKDIKHLKTLVDVAGARGQLNRSQMYDLLDVGANDSLWTKVQAITGGMFHYGERMNRQVALIAAYELELQKQVGAGKALSTATEAQRQKAAEEAIYLTELTNGGTAAAAAPRIAQNSIGRVAFMYKRYGVSMYYMLFKTTRDAMFASPEMQDLRTQIASEKKKDRPDAKAIAALEKQLEKATEEHAEVSKAAKKQLAYIYASAGLMAGVQGLPMYGVIAMMYNLFLRDDDEEDFDSVARKGMGELRYAGLGNAVFGVELASRFGLSDLLFRDTTTRPSDSVMLSLMEQMGGPVIGVASRMIRGTELISEGYGMRGLEQMLPSAAGNALKSIRFATEGTNTLRGDPITGEIGPWNAFAQFFGFAPAEYIRQLEINSSGKNIERASLEDRSNMLRKLYIAIRQGDNEEAKAIFAKIGKFNSKHPSIAITADTIEDSMRQHMLTTASMYHGITINKKMRAELMAHFAEFDED